jgi:hypothetical protein
VALLTGRNRLRIRHLRRARHVARAARTHLNAAGKLSALAVGDLAIVPGNQTFIIRRDRS